MQIAPILKELRLSNGLTQKELASKLGIGQSTIVGYERGEREPTINNLSLYAKYFNVSADYLLGLEDDFGVKVNDREIEKRPDYDLTDKQLADFIKLFKVMTEVQKAQVIGFVVGLLEAAGVNVKAILG